MTGTRGHSGRRGSGTVRHDLPRHFARPSRRSGCFRPTQTPDWRPLMVCSGRGASASIASVQVSAWLSARARGRADSAGADTAWQYAAVPSDTYWLAAWKRALQLRQQS